MSSEHVHDWVLTETGYVRTWSTVIDDDEQTITASFSGTDDWSDLGAEDDHLQCSVCGATRPIPDGYEVVFD